MKKSRFDEDAWDKAAARSGSLFHTRPWQSALEKGLDASSLYLEIDQFSARICVTVFSIGPFKIAYLGFPVGGTMEGLSVVDSTVRELKNSLSGKLTCLRIAQSAVLNSTQLPFRFVETPETAIMDLQTWDISQTSKNIQRDVKKAIKNNVAIAKCDSPEDAQKIYALYKDTIARAGGSLRYTEQYFSELVWLSLSTDKLLVAKAVADGKFVGFNIAGVHCGSAYYLHGGIDYNSRAVRPASLLMKNAIEWAQSRSASLFNFMSSPPQQRSLIEYKEKWGGKTFEHRTYEIGMGSLYTTFRFADKCRVLLSNLRQRG